MAKRKSNKKMKMKVSQKQWLAIGGVLMGLAVIGVAAKFNNFSARPSYLQSSVRAQSTIAPYKFKPYKVIAAKPVHKNKKIKKTAAHHLKRKKIVKVARK